MPAEPIVLLIYTLAVIRLTGLVTLDAITEPAREKLLGWLDDRPATLGSWLTKLLDCPWCASMWIAAAAAPAIWWHAHSPWLLIPALALALSQAAGMTSQIGR
jgi:hypothetical protein